MDPITALANMRDAINEYWILDDMPEGEEYNNASLITLDKLVIAAEALDTWMTHGGCSPWTDKNKS